MAVTYSKNTTSLFTPKLLHWFTDIIKNQSGIGFNELFLFSVGIGYASIVIVSLLNIYYIVILAWGLYYLFQCFQPELPWAKCNQPWNTDRCVEDTFRKNKTLMLAANITNFTSPVTEFWE